MPNTSRGYPYPLSTAPADVPADLLLLANALNTDVGTVATTASTGVTNAAAALAADTENTIRTIMGAWI
jgi:hypothetical protein